MKDKLDILFLDGLIPRDSKNPHYIGFSYNIGAVLRENNLSFKIFNLFLLQDFSINAAINEFKKINFSTIGISTSIENIRWVYIMVDAIKTHFPDIPVILGGPQASYADTKVLKGCKCDVVVRFEGEYTLLNLLNYYIHGNGKLENIKGITYRVNDKIIYNEDSDAINLDELPSPLYEIYNSKEYWHVPEQVTDEKFQYFLSDLRQKNNVFMTARGCPYRCIFCLEGLSKNKLRERSIEKVEEDLKKFIININLKTINIGDDAFVSNKSRVEKICNVINALREEQDFNWCAEGRIDVLVRNPGLLNTMINAGLRVLQVGFESGSQKVLDVQNKGITLDQIRKVAKEVGTLNKETFFLVGNFLFGGPGETEETLAETLEFAKELYKLSNFKVNLTNSFFIPFDGTLVKKSPEKYNMVILNNEIEMGKKQYDEIVCHPVGLDINVLREKYATFHTGINEFINKSMVEKQKSIIDTNATFKNNIANSNVNTSQGYPLHFYFQVSNQNSSIKQVTERNVLDAIPFKVLEINYLKSHDFYFLLSSNRKLITIKNKNKFLWENANGKLRIRDIIKLKGNPFKSKREAKKVCLKFFEMMHANYAVVFKEY